MGSEKKSVNNKTNLHSEEYKKSYSQALKLGNDNLMVNDEKSIKRLENESLSMKKSLEKDQNQAYKFNFNSR